VATVPDLEVPGGSPLQLTGSNHNSTLIYAVEFLCSRWRKQLNIFVIGGCEQAKC
jgi:hypothetical protein